MSTTRDEQRQELAGTLAEFIGEVAASLSRVEAALLREYETGSVPKLALVRDEEGNDA